MAKLIERKHLTKPFVVRWFKPTQGQRSFATREEAERFMVSAELIERGESIETFREYATRWNEQTAANKTPATVRIHESNLRLHVFPVIGDLPLTEITREMLKD